MNCPKALYMENKIKTQFFLTKHKHISCDVKYCLAVFKWTEYRYTINHFLTVFSIAADVRRYTSSILQSVVAYFNDRNSVDYFGFGE